MFYNNNKFIQNRTFLMSILLTMVFPIFIQSALADTVTLYLHMKDIDLIGDKVKIKVTGEYGQSVQWRQALLPLVHDELIKDVRGFDLGENLETCVTNFDVGGETSCETSNVDDSGAADFYIEVPQDWN